jgi:MFS family permease
LLLVNVLSLLVTGALQYNEIVPLFVFRSFQGIVSGIWMTFIPAYIGELTPKEIGSRFGIYPQVAVVLGVLISFTVGMIMTDCFDYEFLPTDVPV